MIKQTRANFNIDSSLWFIFRTIVGKQTAINDDGTRWRAKPADVLKEFIVEYIGENQDKLKEILEEAKALNVNNQITTILEEMAAEATEA
jgi:hypothetical protein